MERTEAALLLRTFDRKEQKDFKQFLESPWVNGNTRIINLYELIEKKYFKSRSQEPQFPDSEWLWEQIFGKTKKFNPVYFRNLVSDLKGLIFKFWAIKRLAASTVQSQLYIQEELYERDLEGKFSESLLKESRKSNSEWAKEYYEYEYKLMLVEYAVSVKSGRRVNATRLPKVLGTMDRFFLYQKLKFATELLSFQNVLHNEVQNDLINSQIAAISDKERKEFPTLHASILSYELLKTGTKGVLYFRELSDYLFENWEKLPFGEVRRIYNYLQNFAIRRVNEGAEDGAEDLFLLMRSCLTRGILFEADGQFSPWSYKNIATAALKIKKFDWVEGFIETYIHFVPPELKKDVYHYNRGHLSYHRGEYGKARKEFHLMNAESDIFLSIDKRHLLLRMELIERNKKGVHHMVKAFNAFLKRNKTVRRDRIDYNIKFNRFAKRIIDFKTLHTGEKVGEELKAEKGVRNKKWLWDQLQERLKEIEEDF